MADLPAKALSIRQPWAWAIIHAGKDIENRDWPTKFRGPVCIHAARGMTIGDYAAARSFMSAMQKAYPPNRDDLQRGGIIGVAEIIDCVEASESPWFMGRYGFVLRNMRAVPFIPVKGALGFFDWRNRVEAPNA